MKYADVVSGDDGMSVMVSIGGGLDVSVFPLFMILKNEQRSCTKRDMHDNIPEVPYRTPKTRTDHVIFNQWLTEIKALPPVSPRKKMVLFLDNCSNDAFTEEVIETLRKIRTEVRFLPADATDLCQPADSFVIQNVKAAWGAKSDVKKLSMIENICWVDPKKKSGDLVNPRKMYCFNLTKNAVGE